MDSNLFQEREWLHAPGFEHWHLAREVGPLALLARWRGIGPFQAVFPPESAFGKYRRQDPLEKGIKPGYDLYRRVSPHPSPLWGGGLPGNYPGFAWVFFPWRHAAASPTSVGFMAITSSFLMEEAVLAKNLPRRSRDKAHAHNEFTTRTGLTVKDKCPLRVSPV